MQNLYQVAAQVGRTTDSNDAEAQFLEWFAATQGVAVKTELTDNEPQEDDEAIAFFRRMINGDG